MALLENLKGMLRAITTPAPPFDPAVFGDPLALRTEWTAAKRGGTNFRTHKLVVPGASRAEFRATAGAILFSLVFFLLGLGFSIGLAGSWLSGSFSFEPGLFVPLGLGLIFTGIGAYLFYSFRVPIVFEKGRGVFWKGRKGPDEAIDSRSAGRYVRLDQIHAVQILSEYVSGKNSYYSFELNLVLEDGKRINVIDHGSLIRIREDAKKLALFLGKPLWDATA